MCQNIHTPVEKTQFPYIFAFCPVNSCLDTLYIVYIFRQESRSLATERDVFITIRQRYPQTHRLWIKYPVDGKIGLHPTFLEVVESYARLVHMYLSLICIK